MEALTLLIFQGTIQKFGRWVGDFLFGPCSTESLLCSPFPASSNVPHTHLVHTVHTSRLIPQMASRRTSVRITQAARDTGDLQGIKHIIPWFPKKSSSFNPQVTQVASGETLFLFSEISWLISSHFKGQSHEAGALDSRSRSHLDSHISHLSWKPSTFQAPTWPSWLSGIPAPRQKHVMNLGREMDFSLEALMSEVPWFNCVSNIDFDVGLKGDIFESKACHWYRLQRWMEQLR